MSTITFESKSAPKVRLKPRRALPFFSHHPWVFAGAIDRIEGEPPPGGEVALYSSDGQFIAAGLYNPASQIRVRLYSWTEGQALDSELWGSRLDAAIALRQSLYGPFGPETACRLVFSEADELSGLVVDRYGDWLLVQFTALGLWQRRILIFDLLESRLKPRGIWLRTEKGMRESERLELTDGLARGEEPPRPQFIVENDLRFGVDVVQGHRPGFYLDQRENRVAAARYLSGHRVLDLFCYTGAFGIAAVKHGGTQHVHAVDSSETALALARANAELNQVSASMQFEKSDVFEALERFGAAGETFDTVNLDPPKMTRHRAGIEKALRGYHSLNELAVRVLRPGGILVTCSCSGLVGRDDFVAMLSAVSQRADRPIQILESRGQAADHPISVHCLESGYLKCYICRVA